MIFPPLKRALAPVVTSFSSRIGKSTKGYSKNTGGDPQPGSIRLEDKLDRSGGSSSHMSSNGGRRGNGPRELYPITNITYTESEERMVDAPNAIGVKHEVGLEYSSAASVDGGVAGGRPAPSVSSDEDPKEAAASAQSPKDKSNRHSLTQKMFHRP